VDSTSAPSRAPKKIAKVELKKMAVPSPYGADPAPGAEPSETPPQVHPVFAKHWDPLEAPPAVFFENGHDEMPAPALEDPPPPLEREPEIEPGVVEMRPSEARDAHKPEPPPSADPIAVLRAEMKDRHDEILVLESRMETL